MKTVLLTGATGFVGSHVADVLLASGWTVKAAVRSRDGLARLDERIQGFVTGPIEHDTKWDDVVKGVDVVVHLAARVHVLRDTDEDPLEAYRNINVRGTQRLLEACVNAGVKRFVFMSSVKALGESSLDATPIREIDPCKPLDAYGKSKAEAEQIVLGLSQSGRIEAAILRPPMVYGPGVKANFLRLMRAVDAGVPLPFGRVRNHRSMVYVKNLADAVKVCSEHPRAAVGQVFFVSDDRPLSTPELIREIAQALAKRPRLIPVPVSLLHGAARVLGMAAEIDRLTGSLVVSTDKIRNILGWTPPYTVSEGIADTVNWYRSEHHRSQDRR